MPVRVEGDRAGRGGGGARAARGARVCGEVPGAGRAGPPVGGGVQQPDPERGAVAFDIEHIGIEALLFQTGYLTILGEESLGAGTEYRLGYPNLEVRQSLNEHLLRRLDPDAARIGENRRRLHRLLEAGDAAGLKKLFHAFFAGIPHQWHVRNDIAAYEGYYASVFYSYFAGLGLDVTVEDSTSQGRLDMAVRAGGQVYLFEFKVVEQAGAGTAMAQLVERGCAEKYRGRGAPVHLVGVEFSSRTRNVERFEVRDA